MSAAQNNIDLIDTSDRVYVRIVVLDEVSILLLNRQFISVNRTTVGRDEITDYSQLQGDYSSRGTFDVRSGESRQS